MVIQGLKGQIFLKRLKCMYQYNFKLPLFHSTYEMATYGLRHSYLMDTPRPPYTRSYSVATRYLRDTFVYNPVKEMSTTNDILKL